MFWVCYLNVVRGRKKNNQRQTVSYLFKMKEVNTHIIANYAPEYGMHSCGTYYISGKINMKIGKQRNFKSSSKIYIGCPKKCLVKRMRFELCYAT